MLSEPRILVLVAGLLPAVVVVVGVVAAVVGAAVMELATASFSFADRLLLLLVLQLLLPSSSLLPFLLRTALAMAALICHHAYLSCYCFTIIIIVNIVNSLLPMLQCETTTA